MGSCVLWGLKNQRNIFSFARLEVEINIVVVVQGQTCFYMMAKLPPYRNQSVDLHCKSIDWFLYDGNFGI